MYEKITAFSFIFEERTAKPNNRYTKHVAGSYNLFFDEIKIYLPSIANSLTFWVPGSMHLFKPEWQTTIEDNIISATQQAINHEYMHKALETTECHFNKHHFAIEMIEDFKDAS